MTPTAVLAIGMPGYQEMLIILVIGLLIFGRRLPEVGRAMGKTLMQLRRGVQDFKEELRRDEDLQDARSTIREIKQAVDVPRTMANPKRMLSKVAEDVMRDPEPESPTATPGKESADDEPRPAE